MVIQFIIKNFLFIAEIQHEIIFFLAETETSQHVDFSTCRLLYIFTMVKKRRV